MNYENAVRYLLTLGRELAAPTQAAASKFNLENISVLLERLGRPERAFPCVHIAGTNGKGSTAAFMESIFRKARFRTGLNTSPHLERINERIQIAGREISDELFAESFTRIAVAIEELLADGKLKAHPTYFECVTAIAFEAFARERVDFAVVEVGLGGRLDATNVLIPVVSVITRIDFDHENFLGHSLREIAAEKAGVLKERVPAVMAGQSVEAREVLLARAKELQCPVVEVGEAFTVEKERVEDGFVRATVVEKATGAQFAIAPQLAGRFQLLNALNALACARLLQEKNYKISDLDIVEGIAATRWPGRIERVQTRPDVYLDGAHNPGAARELAKFIEENFQGRRVYMLFGAMRDKAVDEVTGRLFPQAYEVIFTEAHTPRAISAAQLQEIAGHHAERSLVIPDAEKALETALIKARPGDAIFITGSLYLVGQLRHVWRDRAVFARASEKP
ncbi:MAG TPA: folylpolyglutamate synthase/dihydrofolate synthase family protein [Candidatus Acidoferrum sp.]|jgi:dihydrofolate synthase/folylpolyglutamate synthase